MKADIFKDIHLYKHVEKPWGYETWLEVNDKYVVKKLHINENQQLSLQFHRVKTETLFLLTGKIEVVLGDLTYTCDIKKSRINIPDNTIHRFKAIGNFAELIEVSTPELDDVVRLEDDYDRVERIVAVSGGFDPLHNGHIRLFEEARTFGTKLVVIINNDNWLKAKKKYTFMPEDMRVEIIKSLRCVDDVYLTKHGPNPSDMSVCDALEDIIPHVFVNGGDRTHDNIPEVQLCDSLGIRMAFNVGGEKIASSSELIDKYNNRELDCETGYFCRFCGAKNNEPHEEWCVHKRNKGEN